MPELTQPAEQQTPHILVVDDDAGICQVVFACLQKKGWRISCAEDVAAARRLLRQDKVDVIVTDVMMPGEDGIQFLTQVHESNPDIPVIIMTGHAQLQMAVNAIKNGAFDFIHKPFDFDYLRKVVERAVSYSRLQRMERDYRSELEKTVARQTAELKKSMAELDFARAALQQASMSKSLFMSTVSHEMRTPMNCVIGSLELLSEETLSGAAPEYLAMARQSADNMMVLINQLLSFNARNIQGGGGSHHELVDLQSLLHEIVAVQQPLFKRKGINLVLQISDDLPRRIWSDREKMSRLLEILLGNALKFTEHGAVSLAVSRTCSEAEGDLLHCTVTDSGIGIPDGMLERIFEPFVQGDGSLTRRYEGVGLGLAIARQNALLLDGHVWAEHVPAGGSRFTVTIKISTP